MKYKALLCLIFLNHLAGTPLHAMDTNATLPPLASYTAPWLVIGAGPAGISAVAALRDAGISPEKIIWVDDSFTVGALGKSYRNVPPNSPHKSFFNFFNQSHTLRRHSMLFRNAPGKPLTRTLTEVIDPLQKITYQLRNEVASVTDRIHTLTYDEQNKLWVASLPAITLKARNVIFAVGATPKTLPHAENQLNIPLNIALDAKKLKLKLRKHQQVAVFGSSHSAALALKNLVEAGCPKIIHIYKHKFRFRKKVGDSVLYPFSGLKSSVGVWAKKNLPHEKIHALHIDDAAVADAVAQCTAIIDAIGFDPVPIPVDPKYLYPKRPTPHELGPGLYGVGIAYPSIQRDAENNEEFAVGLLSFMQAIKKELPAWIAADKKKK